MGEKGSLMTKVSNGKKRVVAYATMLFVTLTGSIMPAYAAAKEVKPNDVIQQLISIIGQIFVGIGAILLVYSVGQLVLAFKNEDPDSKSKATSILVVSAILMGFPAIIKTLGLDNLLDFSS